MSLLWILSNLALPLNVPAQVIAQTPCILLSVQKQTLSGDALPPVVLENLFRYASMRTQARNSRLKLIRESLEVLQVSFPFTLCVRIYPSGSVVTYAKNKNASTQYGHINFAVNNLAYAHVHA